MRYVFILIISLGVCFSSFASEIYGHGEGGSLRPYSGRSKSIRLVREKIKINFVADSVNYDVLTDYVFVNEGKSCTIKMFVPILAGFLVNNDDVAGLSIKVDGIKTPIIREVVSGTSNENLDYDVRWVTSVKFKARQKRHIRVRYRSKLSGKCGDSLFYTLSGNSWLGLSETSLLLVSTSPRESRSGTHSYGGESSKEIRFRRKRNNAYSLWRNWQPDGMFQVS